MALSLAHSPQKQVLTKPRDLGEIGINLAL